MSAFKGTPGPWAVREHGMWDITVDANGGGTIARVNNKGDFFPAGESADGTVTTKGRSQNRMLADATLIAAAPELLEALEEMVESACAAAEILPNGTHRIDATAAEWRAHVDATAKARAALSRATGGQS